MAGQRDIDTLLAASIVRDSTDVCRASQSVIVMACGPGEKLFHTQNT